jgi:hypothetical protein
MTTLLASEIRVAVAGIVVALATPANTTRPSRTSRVAFGIGARPVPSMSVASVNASVCAAVAVKGAAIRQVAVVTLRVRCWIREGIGTEGRACKRNGSHCKSGPRLFS